MKTALRPVPVFLLGLALGCSSPGVESDPASPPALRGLRVLGCDTGLRVEFAAPLDPASVTAESFTVEQVPGVATYDPSGRALTFRPQEPFDSGETYAAVLSAELRSSGGTPLGEPVRWQFACVDRTPPVVVARQPTGEGVTTLAHPTVRFSEPMDEGSLTQETVRLAGVDAQPVYDAAKREVSLVPRQPLYPGRTYVVTVSSKVRDVNGNALGTEVSWTFATREALDDWAVLPVTPPLPAAAPCDTPIELRLAPAFDVDVAAFASEPPLAIEGVPGTKVSYDAARRILRVEPLVPLRPGATYAVHATAALRDRTGDRPFDEDAQVLEVQVLPTCDEPTVALVGDAGSTISCDGATSVRFSVPMERDSTLAAVSLADLTEGGYDPARAVKVPAEALLSDDGRTVTVQPQGPLTDGHRYLLAVAGSAKGADTRPLHQGGRWELGARCP